MNFTFIISLWTLRLLKVYELYLYYRFMNFTFITGSWTSPLSQVYELHLYSRFMNFTFITVLWTVSPLPLIGYMPLKGFLNVGYFEYTFIEFYLWFMQFRYFKLIKWIYLPFSSVFVEHQGLNNTWTIVWLLSITFLFSTFFAPFLL